MALEIQRIVVVYLIVAQELVFTDFIIIVQVHHLEYAQILLRSVAIEPGVLDESRELLVANLAICGTLVHVVEVEAA